MLNGHNHGLLIEQLRMLSFFKGMEDQILVSLAYDAIWHSVGVERGHLFVKVTV